MAFDPSVPYNTLPELPPSQDIETKAVLRKCIDATRRLEGLRQAAKLIPNQDVLINSIPLREAQDSSEIENIVTTNDRLYRFANTDGEHADPATREILRYRTALRNGFDNLKVRPLTVQTALTLCRTIKDYDLDVRALPGTTSRTARPGKLFTPPLRAPMSSGPSSAIGRDICTGRRRGSYYPHGCRPLSVRSHSPVSGWQRTHGPCPQHPLSDRAKTCSTCRFSISANTSTRTATAITNS